MFCNRALSSSAMRKRRLLVIVAIALIDTGCTSVFGATKDFVGEPFKTADLPQMKGQIATCNGHREKTFTLEAGETMMDLGLGIKFAAWTYNGALLDRSSRRAKATA